MIGLKANTDALCRSRKPLVTSGVWILLRHWLTSPKWTVTRVWRKWRKADTVSSMKGRDWVPRSFSQNWYTVITNMWILKKSDDEFLVYMYFNVLRPHVNFEKSKNEFSIIFRVLRPGYRFMHFDKFLLSHFFIWWLQLLLLVTPLLVWFYKLHIAGSTRMYFLCFTFTCK